MKQIYVFLLLGFFLLSFFNYLSAEMFYGDGTYDVKAGDFLIADNGWKLEVDVLLSAHKGDEIIFSLYDSEGFISIANASSLNINEGSKKIGPAPNLKINLELLDVFGESTPTDSPIAFVREFAKVKITSIDEDLPSTVSDSSEDELEIINKDLTFKNATKFNLALGEKHILKNGYKLGLIDFDMRFNSPMFSLWNENDDLILDSFFITKKPQNSFGTLVFLDDYDSDSVSLKKIEGSHFVFGSGWNLFSIFLDDGSGFGTVLETTCNNGVLWIWNPELDDYENIGFLEVGQKIPSNKGVWIKVTVENNSNADFACETIISGSKSVTTKGQELKAGWNLIGAPITANGKSIVTVNQTTRQLLNINDILGDCKLEKGPWQFVSSRYSSFLLLDNLTDLGVFSKPIDNNLRLNYGYFVFVSKNCVLGDVN
jgi:hypothetical protein